MKKILFYLDHWSRLDHTFSRFCTIYVSHFYIWIAIYPECILANTALLYFLRMSHFTFWCFIVECHGTSLTLTRYFKHKTKSLFQSIFMYIIGYAKAKLIRDLERHYCEMFKWLWHYEIICTLRFDIVITLLTIKIRNVTVEIFGNIKRYFGRYYLILKNVIILVMTWKWDEQILFNTHHEFSSCEK